jgi:hypothetical protein
MDQIIVIAIDLIAISLLTFAVYFPRHHRRDLVAAYLGVNVGVLAVSAVLSSSTISFGLGLGLFGVLSIIRLRSYEIDQQEIAYYFASLTLGLLAGLTSSPNALSIALMTLVLAVMYVGDHPRLLRRSRQQNVTLAGVFTSEAEVKAELEKLLDAEIRKVVVKRIDLILNRTSVDVRYVVKK